MKKDLVVGGMMAIIGLFAVIYAMTIPAREGSADPGSGLFPLIGGVGLLICGCGTFFAAGKSKQKANTAEKSALSSEEVKRLGLVLAILIGYGILLCLIGFYISSIPALYALITVFAYEKKIAFWKKLLFSFVVTAVAWFIFQNLLKVMLPSGIFF